MSLPPRQTSPTLLTIVLFSGGLAWFVSLQS
jgi:hypothetical protein